MVDRRSPVSPSVSQQQWELLDHDGRIACLCLQADQAWVQDEVDRAKIKAVQAVERKWLALDRNVTPDEMPMFRHERNAAAAEAGIDVWTASARRDGRCAHAASPSGCRVQGCSHRWRPPPPPADRYFTGPLRRRILERDNYTCQYCGKGLSDDLAPDDPFRANIDHVKPYPTGPTSYENGKTACTDCNAAKGSNESMPQVIDLDEPPSRTATKS
jgi:5-methylcytosine-specific restriction endonuclease McrA